MSLKKNIGVLISNIVAIIISAAMVVPLVLIFLNAFKSSEEAATMNLSLPKEIVWSNFLVVIERGKLVQSFFNSTIYSVFSVALCIGLAAIASYALARNRSLLNKIIYYTIVLGIALPINFVTLVKTMQILQINDTRLGMVLIYAATQMPFAIFLIYSFIAKLPKELDEAGFIDGASPIQLFMFIIFPVLKPVVVTAGVLTFLNTWNDFIFPLYFLNSTDKWPMTLAVYNFFGMYFKDFNLISADIVLTSIPVIAVYIFGQKYIVGGMVSGAVKS